MVSYQFWVIIFVNQNEIILKKQLDMIYYITLFKVLISFSLKSKKLIQSIMVSALIGLSSTSVSAEKYLKWALSVAVDILEDKTVPQEVYLEHDFLDGGSINNV